ncbi:Ataxin-2, C-terminal [Cynara cardunculus var. scolymus]|uniref:Ataxin-2, C-terminal n=1 Tax=Cynara cardunculus var. scolymus TaxID=59895 RepID=A0A103XLM9_CYNCS|nr:Ataxin-2, C-terminal [Cynara cardunculus var. scolymus]
MNPQQVAQSRSSANGFTRRRGEKEMGTRVENKSQPGKSNFNRMMTAGRTFLPNCLVTSMLIILTSASSGLQTGNKVGVESPSRERLVYMTTCLIGHQVEVQVTDGSVFSGIFHATNAEKDFGIILKMARVTKAGSSRGQKNILDSVQRPPSKTLIIPAKDLVQIVAKSVSVTRDGLMNELQHEKLHDIMIDSSISQSRHVELERELEPWIPDDDNPECPELDNTFDRHWNSSIEINSPVAISNQAIISAFDDEIVITSNIIKHALDLLLTGKRGWDQFEANATLFGVKSTFNEELYTTKLDRGPQMRELEREALRIAREIEGEDTQDLHLAEERGIHFHDKFDLDEETKYSSVFRGVDDSGYDENEDVLDSQNSETFGDVSDSVINKSSSDLASGKSNNGSQIPLNFSTLADIQASHLSTSNDHHLSGSLDGERRIQDNQTNQQRARSDIAKEDTDKHMLYEQSQAPKSEESSLQPNKESADKGLSATATAYAPSVASSKAQEKTSSSEVSEGAATVKIHGATQPAVSRARPGSSASSTSECGNAAPAAASGPGLSPSSSMVLMIKLIMLEFRLNPNAKSFVPSPAPIRAASPVSDGSFYYPANVAPVPHMHGMPVGIGVFTNWLNQIFVLFLLSACEYLYKVYRAQIRKEGGYIPSTVQITIENRNMRQWRWDRRFLPTSLLYSVHKEHLCNPPRHIFTQMVRRYVVWTADASESTTTGGIHANLSSGKKLDCTFFVFLQSCTPGNANI